MVKTLKDKVLTGGLVGSKFCDTGAEITWPTDQGLVSEPSPHEGEFYEVIDLVDRAPWDPNGLQATLIVKYDGDPKAYYRYLGEVFDDICEGE